MARPAGVGVGVEVRAAAVALAVGVRVAVGEAVAGVLVAVATEVGVLVEVGGGVGVLVAVGGGFVGVGVELAAEIRIVRFPLLFDIPGSASFPITPATTLSGTASRGMTLMTTEPEAGQVTVVDVSPLAALTMHPPDEPETLKVTAGWKIAVTVTPDAPAGAKVEMLTVKGRPTVPLAGAATPVIERSYDCARSHAAITQARPAARPALRVDGAPAMCPPFDTFSAA